MCWGAMRWNIYICRDQRDPISWDADPRTLPWRGWESSSEPTFDASVMFEMDWGEFRGFRILL